jgi:DNA processing protein
MIQKMLRENSAYPELLSQIPDAPAQLYYKGNWSENLFENCLAVVGSRRMTQYGKRVTEQIVSEVAAAGVTIVSGFMYGVDAAAHKAAVDAKGKTIAVMPCGIERIHPEHQKDLYEKIQETGGLIVSEWEGDSMPQLWTYPKRNRIVAGLSKATLVVEAGLESGSLITANLAKKFGRTLFAVPGPITSAVSKGTAKLLQEGAILVSSAADVLEYFDKKGLFAHSTSSGQYPLADSTAQRILETLQRESLEADLLARTLQIPAAELGTTLSLMELEGLIIQESGKYYAH